MNRYRIILNIKSSQWHKHGMMKMYKITAKDALQAINSAVHWHYGKPSEYVILDKNSEHNDFFYEFAGDSLVGTWTGDL